jgi:hypothetical protein
MTRIFSALAGLLLALHSGLAAYCNNQPLDYYDPLGGQAVPMGLTPEDIGRAKMIGNMMTRMPYQQAWEATTPRDPMMELHSKQAIQVVTTASVVGMPMVAPIRILGVAVLDEALMGSGVASLSQMQANAFAQRPLMSGVPESATTGFVLGGGVSAAVRGAGAVPSLIRPVTIPSVEFPMVPGMPVNYAGGPGAMWAGENGLAAETKITSLSQLTPEHFATRYGDAVFYAGRGRANMIAANASGGTTISQTVGGQALDNLVDWSSMTVAESRSVATPYSKWMAEQASGPVRAWAGGASADSVFLQAELPALLRNPAVNKITILDAINTSKTRIIYPNRP